MKKFNLLMTACAVLILSSCSKKETVVNVDSALLIGEWKVTAVDYLESTTNSFPGDEDLTISSTGEGTQMGVTINFNEQTFTSAGSLIVNVTEFGKVFQRTYHGLLGEGDWSVAGNKLVTDQGDKMIETEILTLNATTLKLKVVTEKVLQLQASILTISTEMTYDLTKK